MSYPVVSIDERRHRLEYMLGQLSIEHRPTVVIKWVPGQLVRAVHLMLDNPTHCLWFQQHNLNTHQDSHLTLATVKFVKAARESKLKFEVIEVSVENQDGDKTKEFFNAVELAFQALSVPKRKAAAIIGQIPELVRDLETPEQTQIGFSICTHQNGGVHLWFYITWPGIETFTDPQAAEVTRSFERNIQSLELELIVPHLEFVTLDYQSDFEEVVQDHSISEEEIYCGLFPT
ncbi:MAG TPA: hypothetical protein VLE47_01600 [Candidatus Saccharimonadales bacterium]|nr:hypothetical protein [Candidatus Saccharimonadales bacterium]